MYIYIKKYAFFDSVTDDDAGGTGAVVRTM